MMEIQVSLLIVRANCKETHFLFQTATWVTFPLLPAHTGAVFHPFYTQLAEKTPRHCYVGIFLIMAQRVGLDRLLYKASNALPTNSGDQVVIAICKHPTPPQDYRQKLLMTLLETRVEDSSSFYVLLMSLVETFICFCKTSLFSPVF